MSGYFYFENESTGQRFAWAKEPTFVCGFAESPPAPLEDSLAESTEPDSPTVEKFREIWRRGHRGTSHRARDENDRLTDRCAACGAKMERRGFRAWAEIEKSEPGTSGDRIAQRLGFSMTEQIPGSGRYFRTKRQARDWAYRMSERKSKVTA
jgi:hypothetical protein